MQQRRVLGAPAPRALQQQATQQHHHHHHHHHQQQRQQGPHQWTQLHPRLPRRSQLQVPTQVPTQVQQLVQQRQVLVV
jgi:hypothetical protein